jgi:hypothetical protein
MTKEELFELTAIDPWWLAQLEELHATEVSGLWTISGDTDTCFPACFHIRPVSTSKRWDYGGWHKGESSSIVMGGERPLNNIQGKGHMFLRHVPIQWEILVVGTSGGACTPVCEAALVVAAARIASRRSSQGCAVTCLYPNHLVSYLVCCRCGCASRSCPS